MSTHQLLSTVARNLRVSERELADLEERKWISTVAKNGYLYLSGQDAFKARFILHLRRLRLTDEEVGMVLQVQRPGTYSLSELPKILGRPVAGRDSR